MNISHTGRLAIRPNWYPVNSLEPKTLYVIFLASYILIFSFSYGGWKLIMKNFWPIDFSPQHRKDHIVTIQFYTRWRREHSSVQFSRSVMSRLSATPWTAACQASLSITNSKDVHLVYSKCITFPLEGEEVLILKIEEWAVLFAQIITPFITHCA